MGLLGLSQGGLVAASAATRDDRIDSMVLWSPAANPYATFSIDIFQPDKVKAVLKAPEDEPINIPLGGGEEIKLKRSFFEELLVVDPIAEIVRFTNPLLVIVVIVGLQDEAIIPQPHMGKLYLRS